MSIFISHTAVIQEPESKMTFPFLYVSKREAGFADLVLIRRYCDESRNKQFGVGESSDLILTYIGHGMRPTIHPFATYQYSPPSDDIAWANRVKGDKFVIHNEIY